ncbi:hypothetical protein K438DRAFT_1764923 [Mycena galopus ATCC 62051]|nr:hypothetical protein K438DRAFT_1764923 [Mycena galopus ATCC 62051]
MDFNIRLDTADPGKGGRYLFWVDFGNLPLLIELGWANARGIIDREKNILLLPPPSPATCSTHFRHAKCFLTSTTAPTVAFSINSGTISIRRLIFGPLSGPRSCNNQKNLKSNPPPKSAPKNSQFVTLHYTVIFSGRSPLAQRGGPPNLQFVIAALMNMGLSLARRSLDAPEEGPNVVHSTEEIRASILGIVNSTWDNGIAPGMEVLPSLIAPNSSVYRTNYTLANVRHVKNTRILFVWMKVSEIMASNNPTNARTPQNISALMSNVHPAIHNSYHYISPPSLFASCPLCGSTCLIEFDSYASLSSQSVHVVNGRVSTAWHPTCNASVFVCLALD